MEPRSRTFMMVDDRPNDEYKLSLLLIIRVSFLPVIVTRQSALRVTTTTNRGHYRDGLWPDWRARERGEGLVCHVVKRQNVDRAAGRNQNQKRGTMSAMARFLATAVLCLTRSVARTRSRLFEFMIIEEHNCAGGTRGHTIRERQRPRFALLSRGIPLLR